MRQVLGNPPEAGRIGYVVSRFPKLSETFVLREMEALERRGWEILVFPFITTPETIEQPGTERFAARCIDPGGPCTVLAAHLYWLRRSPRRLAGLYALVLWQLWCDPATLSRGLLAVARATHWARAARSHGVSHVHAHFAHHPTVAALAIGELAGIPFSFTCHAHDVYKQSAMLGEKVHRAAFVVAVSRLVRDSYIARSTRQEDLQRVRVLHCGTALTLLQRPDRHGDGPPLRLLAVARLVEKKGLTFLLQACGLLRARGCALSCEIIGDGPLAARLQAEVEHAGLGAMVSLLGARSQAEVTEALRRATVFVQPSIVASDGDMEGIPVSLMEAMAAGVPVVATCTGAIPELVEHEQSGLLVAPGDAGALAAAITRLVEDIPLASRMRAEARRRVEADFDLERNVAALERLLRTAIARGGPLAALAGPTGDLRPRGGGL